MPCTSRRPWRRGLAARHAGRRAALHALGLAHAPMDVRDPRTARDPHKARNVPAPWGGAARGPGLRAHGAAAENPGGRTLSCATFPKRAGLRAWEMALAPGGRRAPNAACTVAVARQGRARPSLRIAARAPWAAAQGRRRMHLAAPRGRFRSCQSWDRPARRGAHCRPPACPPPCPSRGAARGTCRAGKGSPLGHLARFFRRARL